MNRFPRAQGYRFLRAHGYEAGPTQRPRLAGALSAAVAELPTLAVLWSTGAVQPLLQSTGLSLPVGLAVHVALVLLAGIIYGQLFQRAANDRSVGWLFGLSFGFLGWMTGPVTVLEWMVGSAVISGGSAQGQFAAYLTWGLLVGLLFPRIHGLLEADLDDVELHSPRSSVKSP